MTADAQERFPAAAKGVAGGESRPRSAPAFEVPIGARLGPYRIQAFLAAGGMGSVYVGEDETLQRRAAIKVLSRLDDNSVRRFLNEARRHARLDHPNVVPVWGAGTDVVDGVEVHYIALKYIEGSSLGELVLECGPLDPAHATQLILDGAKGLRYVHAEGFIHRDVKPGNLLVDLGDRALISDFGIARDPSSDGDTRSGVEFVGTWDYASPEQLSRRPVDARSDVYSLGLTWLYALTGRHPFADARGFEEVPSLSHTLPEPVRATLHRMIHPDPDQRFGSMLQCVDALEATLASLGAENAPWRGRITAEEELGPGRRWGVALLVCGLVVAGAVALFDWRTGLSRAAEPATARSPVDLPAPPPASAEPALHEILLPVLQEGAQRLSQILGALGQDDAVGDPAVTAALLDEARALLQGPLGDVDRQARAASDAVLLRAVDALAEQVAPVLAAACARLESGAVSVADRVFHVDLQPVMNVQYFAFLLELARTDQPSFAVYAPPVGLDGCTWVAFTPPRDHRRPALEHMLVPVVHLHRPAMERFAAHLGRELPTKETYEAVVVPLLRARAAVPDEHGPAGVWECVVWEDELHYARWASGEPRYMSRDWVKREMRGVRLVREVRPARDE